MKRLFAVLAFLSLLTLLTACGANSDGDAELIVFAAASMQETLTEAGETYMAGHPGVKLIYNFDSSGTLKTQIQEGAECDLFISAGQKQMDDLDAAANSGELDFVDAGTRVDLLENRVVLAVPEGNPANVAGFDGLAELLENGTVLLAIGSSDVPVGQYTKKIFAYYQLNEKALNAAGKLTYGSNVKEVTTHISEGAVDCGVIYSTDAFSAGLTVVDTAAPEMCGQVIYPAAVMKNAVHSDEARDFLTWLGAADGGMPVFEQVGFTAVE